MRKLKLTVVAKDLADPRAMALAFDHTFRNFDPYLALAFNMSQKSTRIPKDVLAQRIQKHKDRINARKEKIKLMEKAKKANAMNPDKVQRLSARITKQKERIDKHNEAIKYYKMLANLKPPKVNPLKRGK